MEGYSSHWLRQISGEVLINTLAPIQRFQSSASEKVPYNKYAASPREGPSLSHKQAASSSLQATLQKQLHLNSQISTVVFAQYS